jgi:hypothetical protein
MPFEPHQSLAACTTNIRWRLPGCDRVIADYRGSADPDRAFFAIKSRSMFGCFLGHSLVLLPTFVRSYS